MPPGVRLIMIRSEQLHQVMSMGRQVCTALGETSKYPTKDNKR